MLTGPCLIFIENFLLFNIFIHDFVSSRTNLMKPKLEVISVSKSKTFFFIFARVDADTYDTNDISVN